MAKVSNGDIIDAGRALSQLSSYKLPIKIAYNLALMGKRFQPQLEVLQGIEKAKKLEYGLRPQDNIVENETPEQKAERTRVFTANVQRFNDEWEALRKETIEMDVVKVSLPTKIIQSCDKCKALTNHNFEIEKGILDGLLDFIEITE